MPHPTPDADPKPSVDVDDVVRHTDSGSGASQAEHWKSNVSMPDALAETDPAGPDEAPPKAGIAP